MLSAVFTSLSWCFSGVKNQLCHPTALLKGFWLWLMEINHHMKEINETDVLPKTPKLKFLIHKKLAVKLRFSEYYKRNSTQEFQIDPEFPWGDTPVMPSPCLWWRYFPKAWKSTLSIPGWGTRPEWPTGGWVLGTFRTSVRGRLSEWASRTFWLLSLLTVC